MTRLGTASTKTRYEVHGSRRKVRPQKGTGRARLGDKKSPMLKGGGVAFGPHPRDFSTELPKKVYDLAWRTALSHRYRKGELIIVDNAMEIEAPSTRLLEDIFKHHDKLRGRGRSLLVTLDERPLLEEALTSMGRGEQTLTWEEVDVKDLLELSRVIIERDALRNILLSHQEDLTHAPVRPSRLVRSSPPSDLEDIIGWPQFRSLRLSCTVNKDGEVVDIKGQTVGLVVEGKLSTMIDSKVDAKGQILDNAGNVIGRAEFAEGMQGALLPSTRPAAYQTAAELRFEAASTLPGDSPQRTDLTVSVYNLIGEARTLSFEEKTGLTWKYYNTPERLDIGPEYNLPIDQIIDWRKEATYGFPAVQALDYQIEKKSNEASEEAQVNYIRGEQLELEAAQLEEQKYKLLHEAATLAAQADEHYAVAQGLSGQEEQAALTLGLGSHERDVLEELEGQVLEAEIKVAECKVRVLLSKKRYGKELEEARNEVHTLREKHEA